MNEWAKGYIGFFWGGRARGGGLVSSLLALYLWISFFVIILVVSILHFLFPFYFTRVFHVVFYYMKVDGGRE